MRQRPIGKQAVPPAGGGTLVRIPLGGDDETGTRVLPAPVVTAGLGVPDPDRESEPAPAGVEADNRAEFALLGALAGAAGTAAQLVPQGTWRLVLLLVLVSFGPGAALLSFANVRSRLVAWALTLAGSLTITCGAAVGTLWTHVWDPAATLGVLAGGTLIAGAARLTRLVRAGVPWRPPAFGTGEPAAGGRLTGALPLVALAAAVALWIVALVRLGPADVGAYGFSAALGVPFLLAVLSLCLGFAAELFGRARPAVLTAVLLAVPVIMQAGVPILDGTTEYAWTYKHFGVVDLLRDNGHLLSSTDIYQQWPGFFAVVALISRVAAVDALSFAAWSSLAFGLVNMLMAAALLRQFTADRRIVALGVLLSQAAMWVDIGYFSPQAFVYSLMLAFWIIVARWLLGAPAAPAGPAGRIARVRAWLTRGLPARAWSSGRRGEPGPRTRRLLAAAAATAVFAAITVSHQLTPVVMLVPVTALAVLGLLRPRLLAVVLAAVVVAFVAPRLATVSSQYNVLDFDLLANASGNASDWRTPQQEFSAAVARSLALGVWLTALVAVWRARRRPGRVLVPALLGFLPMATLAGGNYGGEAIYRVFAFSLPFAALLIARWWAGRGRRGARATVASAVVLAAVLLAALQGLQGQLAVHQVRATDVAAAEYFYANAVPDSGLVLAAPNFPTKLTGDYGSFNRGHVSVDISLVGDPIFTGTLDGGRVADVEQYVRAYGYATNYLVVSDAMADYTDYFGTEPPGAMASLDSALRASTHWTVWYQAPGVTIFKLIP